MNELAVIGILILILLMIITLVSNTVTSDGRIIFPVIIVLGILLLITLGMEI